MTPPPRRPESGRPSGSLPSIRRETLHPRRTGRTPGSPTILARPLFTRDRRPVGEHATASASGGPALPRLTGIAVSPFGRSAIFAADTGKPLVVSEGGSVAGFTVRRHSSGRRGRPGSRGVAHAGPRFRPEPAQARTRSSGGRHRLAGAWGAAAGLPSARRARPAAGLPQFRIPGQPMLPPGLRPRVGNGAALQPGLFERPAVATQAQQGQAPGQTAP